MTTNDESYPKLIGIFCDKCDEFHEADYLVKDSDTPEIYFGYARKYLAQQGWKITPGSDLCPQCAKV